MEARESGGGGAALCCRSIIDRVLVWQEALQKIRQKNTMRREVTVELSSQGFWKTGIRSDVCQVAPNDTAEPTAAAHAQGAARARKSQSEVQLFVLRQFAQSSKALKYPAYDSLKVHAGMRPGTFADDLFKEIN